MMRLKPCHGIIALAIFSLGLLHAQESVLTWQGTFKSGVEQRRVQVQVSGAIAEAIYVEFLPDQISIDSSAMTSSELKFSIDKEKGTYVGKVSADGNAVEGMWTWDHHSVPLELKRTTKQAAWSVPFQYQYHLKNVTYARPSPDEPKIPFSSRLAVDYMEQGALAWTAERQCVACHTNGSYMVVRPLMTPQLGAPQKEIRDFFVATLKEMLAKGPSERVTASSQIVYLAAGLAIWDAHVSHRLSPETVQALDLMFSLQRPGGDWFIDDDNNPPLESSSYQLATVAARAVSNAPGWLARQRETQSAAKVNLLKAYLRGEGKMQGDYDQTDLLWAASEYPGLLDAHKTQSLIDMVLARQQADGGWSIRTFAQPEQWGKANRAAKLRAEVNFDDPTSDGHMTGLAIIALRKAGVPASDPRVQRGVAWLLANQRASGRWWTRSLNRDGWQFISYSGTAYPMLALALCDVLPSQPAHSSRETTAR